MRWPAYGAAVHWAALGTLRQMPHRCERIGLRIEDLYRPVLKSYHPTLPSERANASDQGFLAVPQREIARDRAIKAWYHSSVAGHDPHGRVAWQSDFRRRDFIVTLGSAAV
jgi:hypothetical protein